MSSVEFIIIAIFVIGGVVGLLMLGYFLCGISAICDEEENVRG
jgi:hypothetical protein